LRHLSRQDVIFSNQHLQIVWQSPMDVHYKFSFAHNRLALSEHTFLL